MNTHVVFWLISGAVWWLCAHSMTLIVPVPGPWLPVESAVPTGLMMGLLGFFLFYGQLAPTDPRIRLIVKFVGAAAGAYLGWTFARGSLTESDVFLAPARSDKELSALFCGGLGLASNTGMIWLIRRFGERPLHLLGTLLLLLSIVLTAVFLLAVTIESPGR